MIRSRRSKAIPESHLRTEAPDTHLTQNGFTTRPRSHPTPPGTAAAQQVPAAPEHTGAHTAAHRGGWHGQGSVTWAPTSLLVQGKRASFGSPSLHAFTPEFVSRCSELAFPHSQPLGFPGAASQTPPVPPEACPGSSPAASQPRHSTGRLWPPSPGCPQPPGPGCPQARPQQSPRSRGGTPAGPRRGRVPVRLGASAVLASTSQTHSNISFFFFLI